MGAIAKSQSNRNIRGCFCCKKAFKLSALDCRRQCIEKEELCNFTWSFRFKVAAGNDWTSWDPWWNGKNARKFVFLSDGSILQVKDGKTRDMTVVKRKASCLEEYPKAQRDMLHLQIPFSDNLHEFETHKFTEKD